jgi:3-methyladenine DNA glycosylase/8-oxoguanine DNA glycosylase
MQHRLRITTPAQFQFEHTVLSHGWCALLPFTVSYPVAELFRTLRTPRGAIINANITHDGTRLDVTLRHSGALSASAREYCTCAIGNILHLDLDLSPFHRLMRKDPRRRWMSTGKAGRMLRGEHFFEDVVKMILTTNCSWSLTTIMNRNLITRFCAGETAGRAFPLPGAIADSSERELREHVRLGYRAPYILELARRCAKGDLDIEAFRGSAVPTRELYAELRNIRGVGDYAASNLLKLLGRFDFLGLDSWCRMKFAELHHNGTRASDADIERHYEEFGQWKGLVMWLDVTRDWYFEKFPFNKES